MWRRRKRGWKRKQEKLGIGKMEGEMKGMKGGLFGERRRKGRGEVVVADVREKERNDGEKCKIQIESEKEIKKHNKKV